MRMVWVAVVRMLPAWPDRPLQTLAQKLSELARTKVKFKLDDKIYLLINEVNLIFF